MKKVLLTLAVACLSGSMLMAGGGKNEDGNELLRRSLGNSYPMPFNFVTAAGATPGVNPATMPPISTGYYLADSQEPQLAQGFWRPNPANLTDTTYQPFLWRRIVSGPAQFPPEYWENNKEEGLRYFRNPNDPSDSTDNAFAGPIPIGFPFIYNGVRYDSFYVSTNGYIMLSNRRYFYDAAGNRTIPDGEVSAYDPQSEDFSLTAPVDRRPRDGNGAINLNANGLADPTPDNFGYQFMALGNTTNPNGGIRVIENPGTQAPNAVYIGLGGPNNFGLGTSDNPFNQTPIIAPFWDNWQVSVFDGALGGSNQPDDFSKVYYKRTLSGDSLIVYFVDLLPIGNKNVLGNTVNFVKDNRPNRPGMAHYRATAQVILTRTDNSVTFIYQRLQGAVVIAGRVATASRIIRDNAIAGVRGVARYRQGNTLVRYPQHTTYFTNGTVTASGPAGSADGVPESNLAVRFKQWKNTVRVVGLRYFAKDPATGNYTVAINNPENYELLVGDQILGAIQPIVYVQNLTNDIQGPAGQNNQEQDLRFRVRFRIKNDIVNDTIIYNRQVCVDSAYLADGVARWDNLSFGARPVRSDLTAYTSANWPRANKKEGIPPYDLVEVKFPPFETNSFIPLQVGRLTSEVIAEPVLCGGQGELGDEWPFDDTTRVRLFGIRRLAAFDDEATDFSISRAEGALPSVQKWVSIEASVVDGDARTFNPPAPRGSFGPNNFRINSPVIHMNRKRLDNSEIPAPGQVGGDEIRSFPVDLRNRYGAVFSMSYQRVGRPNGGIYPRGFSDQTLVGPEPRTLNAQAMPGAMNTPDELRVEFARPSTNEIENITNIPDNGWNVHPRKDVPGQNFTGIPIYRVFGSGGFARGYSELNKDSALGTVGGLDQTLRVDEYDDGKDFQFNKVYIPIPDTIINAPREGAKNFRFRVRVRARDQSTPLISDDDDDFFVDNVRIVYPSEIPDVELTAVNVRWPYTVTPASQAERVPIEVVVANNGNIAASQFTVQVIVKRKSDRDDQIVYCRALTVPVLNSRREQAIPFPAWNARYSTDGEYIISARLFVPGGDPNPRNDSTFGEFTLNYGPRRGNSAADGAFAYDPATSSQNDVPTFAQVTGRGLTLGGSSNGLGQLPFGFDAGNSSGQLATRFTLFSQDTIYGYQAYFASLNQDLLNISFSVYRDNQGIPGQLLTAGNLLKNRGKDDIRTAECALGCYDQYTTYLLNRPLILQPGTYWVSVAQMGTEGYELGGSGERMGMVTTRYNTLPQPGVSGTNLLAHKAFRVRDITGRLLNDNFIAYENTRFSGNWTAMVPSVGNPGYAHLAHTGFVNGYNTFTRGSFIPMLRPYFSVREFNNPPRYEDTAICNAIVPVELVEFDGVVRKKGIELLWETASEINNAGFYLDRRIPAEDNSNCDCKGWETLAFVAGSGNATSPRQYNHLDANVTPGVKYQYRLRQIDFDGTEALSGMIERIFEGEADVVLQQNYPNPVSEKTTFTFALPSAADVKFEVLDLFGNVVRTLADRTMPANPAHTIEWDVTDNAGSRITSGIYMYRLTVNGQSFTNKLNVVR